MTYVWVYSVGYDLSSSLAEATRLESFAREIKAGLEALGATDCSVGVWNPFRSEREHSGQPQAIVLLINDLQAFSKRDYLIAANALALQQGDAVGLVPVLVGHFDVGQAGGAWTERCRVLLKRLAVDAVRLANPELTVESISLLTQVVRAALQSSREALEKVSNSRTSVFFSYCRRDEDLRDRLAGHLKLLERSGLIHSWHDRNIPFGSDWAAEIDAHLYNADLILLLLSSDFFASDFCSEIEAEVALERHNAGAARAIPIVLRPVVWRHSQLATLQVLPKDARPVTSWESVDSAFVNVCEGIISAALAWKSQRERQPSTRLVLRKHQISTRKRVVDAALPAQMERGQSAMLMVLIRRASSVGLRALVTEDNGYGIEPDDVKSSKPISVEFPVGPNNQPQAITLVVVVDAPDFDPPRQEKTSLVGARRRFSARDLYVSWEEVRSSFYPHRNSSQGSHSCIVCRGDTGWIATR